MHIDSDVRYEHIYGSLEQQVKVTKVFSEVIVLREKLLEELEVLEDRFSHPQVHLARRVEGAVTVDASGDPLVPECACVDPDVDQEEVGKEEFGAVHLRRRRRLRRKSELV